MSTKFHLPVLLFVLPLFATAQAKNYKAGYAIIGGDSLACKVAYDPQHPSWTSITITIDGIEKEYEPGGDLVAFGIRDSNIDLHFGTVLTKSNTLPEKKLFLKKMVTGTVELYEHKYTIYKVKRNAEPGAQNPPPESYTDYYMAKTRGTWQGNPILLPSLKLRFVAPFLNDDATLLVGVGQKLRLEELVKLLVEYNHWYTLQKTN